jgi:hypothetical protein
MKRVLFFSILFSVICLSGTAIAQQLRVVNLDQDNELFASPSTIVLNAGDTLQFRAMNGDFAISITDAVRYFEIEVADIEIQVDSNGEAFSEMYVVRADNEYIAIPYIIYCISTNNWPDAPPRIIISSQD